MLKRRERSTGDIVQDVEESIMSPVEKKVDDRILIPTGSAMLNLACSDNIRGGYSPGRIVNLIGDSSSGKTLLALSMLAEVANKEQFDDYRLIFDDAEAALEFNIDYLFGSVAADRIETNNFSVTIEDYYGNVLKAIDKGEPFIYVLDSFDSITALDEIKRSNQYRDDKKNDKGSYKTEKARMSSEILRVIRGDINSTKSLVLVISQTRDNLGFGAMFQPKVRSGGKALKFYCSHEIWLAVGKKDKVKDLEIGVEVFAKVSKNKLTGKRRNVIFPIYYDYGADDITSCINYLIENKVWKQPKQKINTEGFIEDEFTVKKLIKVIEEEDLEDDLLDLTQRAWTDKEDSVKLNRKRKYA
jgi:recombination protein RecA